MKGSPVRIRASAFPTAARCQEVAVYGEPGDLIFKPRGHWHTFSTAGDEPAQILEIISPAGFESYFERLGALFIGASPSDQAALEAIAADRELEVDLASVPRLMELHGLR
jgi:gentisate 1,2-dioxygenase